MSEIKRIVYIEDDPMEGEIVQRLHQAVSKKFYGEVIFDVIRTWGDGVDYVETHHPDVVILDLALAPDSGTERTIESYGKLWRAWPPIVVLTGNAADPLLRRRCIEAGADDFILKGDARHGCAEMFCERIYNAFLRRKRDEART